MIRALVLLLVVVAALAFAHEGIRDKRQYGYYNGYGGYNGYNGYGYGSNLGYGGYGGYGYNSLYGR